MTEHTGNIVNEGIVWSSIDDDVIVSSKYDYREENYRIVVNDEQEAKEALVMKVPADIVEDKIDEAVLFAEGYYTGKFNSP